MRSQLDQPEDEVRAKMSVVTDRICEALKRPRRFQGGVNVHISLKGDVKMRETYLDEHIGVPSNRIRAVK